MTGFGALASFRRLERISAFHPLLKFKLGHYPPSVASLIHPAAAHRSGRQARVQNAVAEADRHEKGEIGRRQCERLDDFEADDLVRIDRETFNDAAHE
jgi:hypothetical protein